MSRSEHEPDLVEPVASGPVARGRRHAAALLMLAVTTAAMLAIGGSARADAQWGSGEHVERAEHAKEAAEVDGIYVTACAPCHGAAGDGNGQAAFSIAPGIAPRPRDFTKGTYKLRSTPSGAVPTDADLHRTIARGIPRYMPAFAPLGDDLIAALVGRIQRFSPRFDGAPPASVPVPESPAIDADMATRGARLYEELGCAACHGSAGRGNGPAAAALRDTAGLPIWPADLAHPSWFKGGSAPADIYRTLATGMDGTPMPGYGDVFADLAPEKPWQLIAYIASLSREPPAGP